MSIPYNGCLSAQVQYLPLYFYCCRRVQHCQAAALILPEDPAGQTPCHIRHFHNSATGSLC